MVFLANMYSRKATKSRKNETVPRGTNLDRSPTVWTQSGRNVEWAMNSEREVCGREKFRSSECHLIDSTCFGVLRTGPPALRLIPSCEIRTVESCFGSRKVLRIECAEENPAALPFKFDAAIASILRRNDGIIDHFQSAPLWACPSRFYSRRRFRWR
jgi:hypothetical protein